MALPPNNNDLQRRRVTVMNSFTKPQAVLAKQNGNAVISRYEVPPVASVTPTQTTTQTPTPTISVTPSITPTLTLTPTISITPTSTITNTPTISLTPTITPTNTITPSPTPTRTPAVTVTPTISITPSITPTLTLTPTISITPTRTPPVTPPVTRTISLTPSLTPPISPTPSVTITKSVTPTPTKTPIYTEQTLYQAYSIPLTFTYAGFSYNIQQVGSSYPTLTAYRGQNYDLITTYLSSTHPLALRLSSGNTSPVSGTYNNYPSTGSINSGVIMFTPNGDTPDEIIYQCAVHSSMSGRIVIKNRLYSPYDIPTPLPTSTIGVTTTPTITQTRTPTPTNTPTIIPPITWQSCFMLSGADYYYPMLGLDGFYTGDANNKPLGYFNSANSSNRIFWDEGSEGWVMYTGAGDVWFVAYASLNNYVPPLSNIWLEIGNNFEPASQVLIYNYGVGCPTPTPTPTISITPTRTPTPTRTLTPTPTVTPY